MKILRNGRPLDISLILVAAGFLGTIALIQLLRAQVNSSAQQTQRSPTQASAQPNAANAEVHILHVQGNVYMLVGAGGNITVQAGNDGVLLVDTGLAPASEKVVPANIGQAHPLYHQYPCTCGSHRRQRSHCQARQHYRGRQCRRHDRRERDTGRRSDRLSEYSGSDERRQHSGYRYRRSVADRYLHRFRKKDVL